MKFPRMILMPVAALCASMALCCSCGSRQTMKQLREIETYLDSKPDSALAALQAIDTTKLGTKPTKAKFALLHAMALDKNYIDTADTRIIAPAVSFYDKHGTADDRLNAYLYLGTAQYNGNNFSSAIVSFTRALESLPDAKDAKQCGILYARLAETYSMTWEFSQASCYIDKSIDCLENSGNTELAYIERYQKAQNLVNMREWEKALESYSELLSDSSFVNSRIKDCIESDYAMTLITSPSPDNSLGLVHLSNVIEAAGKLNNLNQYGAYAYTLRAAGRHSESDSVFNFILANSGPDNVYYYYWKHRSALLAGDFKDAYYSLWTSMRQSDSLTNIQYMSSVSNAQREYIEQQNQENLSMIKTQRKTLALIIIVLILISLFVAYLICNERRNTIRENNSQAAIIGALEDQLKELRNEKNDKELLIEQLSIEKTKARFTYLSELFEIIYHFNDSGSIRDLNNIYFAIKNKVSSLNSDPKSQKEFEQMLDDESGGIMHRFRTDYPDFSELDFRLASYVFAGFDNTTLTLLLGTSQTNTRTLKNRLRKRIAFSSVKSKDDYLKYFPSKNS